MFKILVKKEYDLYVNNFEILWDFLFFVYVNGNYGCWNFWFNLILSMRLCFRFGLFFVGVFFLCYFKKIFYLEDCYEVWLCVREY